MLFYQQILHHGGILSNYTAISVEALLEPPKIPLQSSYHLVTPQNYMVLKQCNPWKIVQMYLDCSLSIRNCIINLCLPYYHHQNPHLGQYIIHFGRLIGVRINTFTQNKYFKGWPRYKVIRCQIPLSLTFSHHKSITYLVGQFNLHLNNIRIGLLFGSEFKFLYSEYCRYKFELIVLVETNEKYNIEIHDSRIKQLQINSFVLSHGQSFTQIYNNFAIQQLILDESIFDKKIIIYADYYDFNQIICNKHYKIYKQNINTTIVKEIQIILGVNMKMKQTMSKMICTNNSQKITIFSKTDKIMLNRYQLNSQINTCLQKLYNMIIFSEKKKIVVMLDKSPHTICFLLIVNYFWKIIKQGSFYKMKQTQQDLPIFFLEMISTNQQIINTFASKLFYPIKIRQQSNDNQYQINLIQTLLQFKQQQNNQQYIPIISNNKIFSKIIKILNQKQQQQQLIQQNKCNYNNKIFNLQNKQQIIIIDSQESLIQSSKAKKIYSTWIVTDFFTAQELQSIYFSEFTHNIMCNIEYYNQIWQKYLQQETEHQIAQKFENNTQNKSKIQTIKQIKQMQLKVNSKKINNNFTQFDLYSHNFWKSNYQIMHIKQQQQINRCINLEEIMSTKKQNIKQIYEFILSNKKQRRQNKNSRKNQNNINQNQIYLCHKCKKKYPQNFIKKCNFVSCHAIFCNKCLLQYNKVGSLSNQCPTCLSLFQSDKFKINNTNNKCHYCFRNTQVSLRCKCDSIFCIKCCQEQFGLKQLSNLQWICYICKNLCFCQYCQKKRTVSQKNIFSIEQIQKLQNQQHEKSYDIQTQMEDKCLYL